MYETLKKYWGYDSFRPKQEEIIKSALEGRDTLAILPTGGGKSICFQVPAMMRDGICIVISPLIALMKDQVQNLAAKGIKALAVYSGMSHREIDITLDNAVYGDYKFLYVSPERLRTEMFKVRLQKMEVSFLVVDEAHCISQWGYDFRPDYLQIGEIREIIGKDKTVIALTATATPEVAIDIEEKLGFRSHNLIRSSFERKNLKYIHRECNDKLGKMLQICRNVGGSGIIYTGKRKTAEDISKFLLSEGESSEAYHAGMGNETRAAIQQRWKSGETRIIVSTNAFGMGIDKPDVRFVCHYDVPESIEAYFQEAGRAGRDGQLSYAVLLWNETDISRLRQLTRSALPPLEYIRDIYDKVFRYLGIEYGGGAGQGRKFAIEKFSLQYRLHAATAYYAIKYIEKAGYWTLSEPVDIPAKVNFLYSRDALYRIQLGDKDTDTFIKTLMRIYTGLFSGYVPIDEERIARLGHYAVEVVKEKLKDLSSRKIIEYIPKVNSAILSLNNERLTPDNLRLPEAEYLKQRERLENRIGAMIGLLEEEESGRVSRMLRYFGEEQNND